MIYLLCLLLPFVAVAIKGKPFQAILNLFLCLFFYIPGVIHAFAVVKKAEEDKRHKEMIEAINKNNNNV